MGVAGSYLMARLKNEHEVVGFERMLEIKHDSICAWGTIKSTMSELLDKVGVDFSKYVIHEGKTMIVEMNDQERFNIGLHGLCTYNKLGLIKDLIKGCTVHYGAVPKLENLENEFDIIVDCTGFHRTYLPKLERDFCIGTYEYKIEYEEKVPFDDFYIKPFPGMSGYFWYFPLGKKIAHIGAGDYHKQHVVETDKFFNKYGGKITKTVGRPIRLATPDLCRPFYHGKVVGVGESIGTVYPLLGEGIIPSMICADIFVKNLGNNDNYEKEVLEYFKIYGKVFSFVRKKIHKDFSILKSISDVLAIFRYMKKNEKRFGMEIHIGDMMKVARG
jgi:flavin-dependent dehydrogenase